MTCVDAAYAPPHPLKRASLAAGLFLAIALPILWIYTVIKEAM